MSGVRRDPVDPGWPRRCLHVWLPVPECPEQNAGHVGGMLIRHCHTVYIKFALATSKRRLLRLPPGELQGPEQALDSADHLPV
jgi:hypothetical protein